MTQPSGPHQEITIELNADPLVEIGKVVKNTKDNILVITTSKAELVLREHWRSIQQSNDWQAPLLFTIPIALTIPTTDFATRFGVSDYVWRTLFFVIVGMCLLWLVVQLIRRFHGGVMDPRMVVNLLLEGGKPMTAPASSTPATPHADSATTHVQVVPSPDPATASNTTSPAHTENHLSLTSPSLPSVPEQRTQSVATSTGAPERTSPPATDPHGVLPGDRMLELSVGTLVRHRNFGVGTVEEILPGPPRLLLVRFSDPDVSTKRLREDLAPLWRLGGEE